MLEATCIWTWAPCGVPLACIMMCRPAPPIAMAPWVPPGRTPIAIEVARFLLISTPCINPACLVEWTPPVPPSVPIPSAVPLGNA